MKPQVRKKHYFQEEYANLERFVSYFYQIDFIRKTKAKSILFIGVGDGLVSDYLKKISRVKVVTYDIDPTLNPDVVGDIRRLPFKDNEFDLVVACQVLEHIPFKEFLRTLFDLNRISRKKVILSLPYKQTSFELVLRFPFIRTLFKRSFLRFLWTIPIKFPGFKTTSQHYWEIDNRQFSINKIRSIMKENFDILLEQKALLNPYRYFFMLQKKKVPFNNKYVKNYYNKYLSQLPDEYSAVRWFSSKAAQFDYKQTRKALLRIIKNRKFKRALEIGPGDGIWTELVAPCVKSMHVVDQSKEMIDRAKKRLANFHHISYKVQDFLKYPVKRNRYDVIFGIRCLEYFQDKQAAIKKMYNLLNPDGKLIVITKNSKYFSIRGKTSKILHSAQISRKDMEALLKRNGFKIESIYPAAFRWKSKYLIFRVIFNLLHSLFTIFKGRLFFDRLFTHTTESYIYEAIKKQ